MPKAKSNKSTLPSGANSVNKSASGSTVSQKRAGAYKAKDNAGVVAYTKGSRLNDNAVRDAVRRVLKGV